LKKRAEILCLERIRMSSVIFRKACEFNAKLREACVSDIKYRNLSLLGVVKYLKSNLGDFILFQIYRGQVVQVGLRRHY